MALLLMLPFSTDPNIVIAKCDEKFHCLHAMLPLLFLFSSDRIVASEYGAPI